MKLNSADFLKVPNLLSLSRIVLMFPFAYFFYQSNFTLTLICLILIIATDYLDGWSSRHFQQVTELGKILDPLADKICLGAGLLIIFTKAKVFMWPVYMLIFRDLVILILGSYISKKSSQVPSSNLYGKFTSLFLSLTGILFFILPFYPGLLLEKIAFYLYYLSIGFIFLSSFSYTMKAYQLLKK